MEFSKDNLSPEKKKKAYLKIGVLTLIITVFFIWRNNFEKEKSDLLRKNCSITSCEVTGRSSSKINGDIFKYYVSGKTYNYHNNNALTRTIGERYKIKYSNERPEICNVIFSEPIIEKDNYILTNGEITKTETRHEYDRISIKYFSFNKEFKRNLYIKNYENYKIGEIVEIFVNKENPQISYLTNMFNEN